MLVASENSVLPQQVGVLESLYREHHARVLRAAYRVTGNMSDAEDVLQTVFLRLADRDLAEIDPESAGSYLHRAAVNAALDILRARPQGRALPLDDAGPLLDAGILPDRSQESAELRAWLRRALAKLNPRPAEIFILRYLEEYGNREIARMLNISQITVGVILHRVRAQLQQDYRAFMRGRHDRQK